MKINQERSVLIFNVYDPEERKFCFYHSRFPLNFEELCNTALEPLYFTPRETILNRSLRAFAL